MAPAKFQLTKLFVVLAILQQVRPSNSSSPEYDCFDEVSHYGFPNNNIHELKAAAMVVHTVYKETMIFCSNFVKTLGLSENDYEKLLSLLRYVMNNLTPCVTNAERYKDVTESISNQYTELENNAHNLGNNVQEAVHLSSQMQKMNLISKTS
ncbi:hypothetical protein XELAEV_18000776mg [Xenopus laevis]|uniref:Type I interferon 1 n=1 Tax=Xenopus laevis TaxID=8355 RepID=A0A1B1FFS8_XENLA|nr:interferon-like LOC124416882 precursor [Xenopus laevis]ANQ43313.1 type I interferon 1 [Xenopus laevis]OCT59355.1 hypothetical protein XELAEV_18000776mg [Xenopus laevis]